MPDWDSEPGSPSVLGFRDDGSASSVVYTSSPPPSSPAGVTSSDCKGYSESSSPLVAGFLCASVEDSDICSDLLCSTLQNHSHGGDHHVQECKYQGSSSSLATSFLHRLDDLLAAVQRHSQGGSSPIVASSSSPSHSTGQFCLVSTNSGAADNLRADDLTVKGNTCRSITPLNTAYTLSSIPRKRLRSISLCRRTSTYGLWKAQQDDSSRVITSEAAHKKRKLSRNRSELARQRSVNNLTINYPRLSGAFRLRYAKGPGSLRRAESLHVELPAAKDLNEVVDRSEQQLSKSSVSDGLTATIGSIASPFGAYAPTVPTTPTANDPKDCASSTPFSPLTFIDVPIIEPPPFELIPRAPLCADEAAERRIVRLLERERGERDMPGLQSTSKGKGKAQRTGDEEEKFWLEEAIGPLYDDSAEEWADVGAHVHTPPSYRKPDLCRASIADGPLDLKLGDGTLEQVIQWFLEVMPSDDYKTCYSPGDLFDLLSTSPGTRFHAGYLFTRYLLHASGLPASPNDEGQDAPETLMWDIAVACVALSVKFHRDVLFPLDVIYAQEFIDLAPCEMEFDDLEKAQRDVLEALSYSVASATPDAFMEELWETLPTLRRLVSFDGGWDDVQEEAWVTLFDALQQPDFLLYPISLVTGAAVIEGVVEVLSKRYKSIGVDGRGKPVKKKSWRKAATKSSRGVRLDIQDVLHLSDEELLACQRWLDLPIE